MAFIDSVKEALPDYAKDAKLNLDAVLLRSTLNADEAMGCAVAALFLHQQHGYMHTIHQFVTHPIHGEFHQVNDQHSSCLL